MPFHTPCGLGFGTGDPQLVSEMAPVAILVVNDETRVTSHFTYGDSPMHTASTANETLEFLWENYLTLAEKVDLDSMPPDILDVHIKRNSPVRPLRIAAWLARQGYFIAGWALWEYYARSLCESLPNKQRKAASESTIDWVGRSLAANDIAFTDQEWFVSANSLRNLIAHSGARAHGTRAERLLTRSRTAFSDIQTRPDGYVDLTHCHIAELDSKIKEFIDDTA